MKRLKNSYIAIMLVALCSSSLLSCGGEESEPTPYPEGSDREYIEQTGKDVLNYFDYYDQYSGLVSMHRFVQCCKEYTFPENLRFEDTENLSRAAQELDDVLSTGDYGAVSRAASQLIIAMSRFNGLYVADPEKREWTFIEARNHVMMRFWEKNKEYNLSLQGDGGSWSENYTTSANKVISMEVPKRLLLYLYEGTAQPATQLMKADLTTDFKNEDHLTFKTDVKFMNLEVVSEMSATQTRLTEKTKYYVDAKTQVSFVHTLIASSTTTINGNNLCSARYWDKVINDDMLGTLLKSMVESGNTQVDVLERMRIKGTATGLGQLYPSLEGVWDTQSSRDPRSDAQKAASELNKAITGKVYFTLSGEDMRATMGWEAYQSYEDPSREEWNVRPTLTFVDDGGTYDFESYFGNSRFFSVESQFKNILRQYKNVWS